MLLMLNLRDANAEGDMATTCLGVSVTGALVSEDQAVITVNAREAELVAETLLSAVRAHRVPNLTVM
jgi:hypothetical protein